MSELKQQLIPLQERIEQVLSSALPAANLAPEQLHQAMRYSTLDGGKRIRPVLVYATGRALGCALEVLDAPAAAVECIHAYSLIHDDLPAMDDDDLRRGKPTCHKAFDEATAILAGDGLQTLAFEILSDAPNLSATQRLAMVRSLALASGHAGMVGGQAIDLAAVGQMLTLEELQTMHEYKTGALIRAAVRLGGLSVLDEQDAGLQKLDHYAHCIGLAFQIRDDILDVESDTATLGKTQGADIARNKPTYPALLGMDEAKDKARQLNQEAKDSLTHLGSEAQLLRDIADFIVSRIQ